MEYKEKFLDFDGRPTDREIKGDNFICCKCGIRYQGKPKFYLAFKFFPFILHPSEHIKFKDGELEYLPIGSSCIKKDELKEWSISPEQVKIKKC